MLTLGMLPLLLLSYKYSELLNLVWCPKSQFCQLIEVIRYIIDLSGAKLQTSDYTNNQRLILGRRLCTSRAIDAILMAATRVAISDSLKFGCDLVTSPEKPP